MLENVCQSVQNFISSEQIKQLLLLHMKKGYKKFHYVVDPLTSVEIAAFIKLLRYDNFCVQQKISIWSSGYSISKFEISMRAICMFYFRVSD